MSTPEQPYYDVDEAFDPVLRQARRDNNLYAESRPYMDENGGVHDPSTGKLVDPDTYFDNQREIARDTSQATPYEELSMPALARKLAEAEFHKDRTSADNIGKVLMKKMTDFEDKVVEGHEATQRTGERHDDEHNKTFRENFQKRIMGVKEKELERLKGADEKGAKQENAKKPADKSEKDKKQEGNKPGKKFSDKQAADKLANVDWSTPKNLLNPADRKYNYAKNRPKTPEEQKLADHGFVRYERDENGDVRLGLEVSQPGITVDPAEHMQSSNPELRQIILTDAKGDEYYIMGGHLHHLGRGQNTKPNFDPIPLPDKLRPITIGETYQIDGVAKSASPIAGVKVSLGVPGKGEDIDGFDEIGPDPFDRAEAILAERYAEPKQSDSPETAPPADDPNRLSDDPERHRKPVAPEPKPKPEPRIPRRRRIRPALEKLRPRARRKKAKAAAVARAALLTRAGGFAPIERGGAKDESVAGAPTTTTTSGAMGSGVPGEPRIIPAPEPPTTKKAPAGAKSPIVAGHKIGDDGGWTLRVRQPPVTKSPETDDDDKTTGNVTPS